MHRIWLAMAALGCLPAVTYAADDPLADLRAVSPALASYTQHTLFEELWKRPGLSPRDRSLVTVAAIVARNQVSEMPFHFRRALDNGVTPGELSELITHLAFYAGWGNATAAAAIALPVFRERGITEAQLPPVHPALLAIDPTQEDARARFVQSLAGDVAPGVVDYTGRVVFHDLWLRPGLSPRDRSLVTISALIANAQTGQLSSHIERGVKNGLTKAQIGEALTQLEFYAGWPNVFTALPFVKAAFDKSHTGDASRP